MNNEEELDEFISVKLKKSVYKPLVARKRITGIPVSSQISRAVMFEDRFQTPYKVLYDFVRDIAGHDGSQADMLKYIEQILIKSPVPLENEKIEGVEQVGLYNQAKLRLPQLEAGV